MSYKAGLIIRTGRKSDLQIVKKLIFKIFNEDYRYLCEQTGCELFSKKHFFSDDNNQYYKDLFTNTNKQTRCYVAEYGSQVIGLVAITKTSDDEFEAHSFYVDANYRGQGIGKKLWGKMIGDITFPATIFVDVFMGNQNTIKMYKGWGFAESHAGFYQFRWATWPENAVTYMKRYERKYN